ncbi:probable glutamate receptor [Corticium candelabrum]|uniref:probable glutamate receptor n=1 Tax=Corticium candelabrum TaxID=121492 RepID=UPI002E261309|nr:probable glutamate receptor [Corticium candelabrum]
MSEVPDRVYGTIDPETNQSTGMVERLINCVRDKSFDIIIVCQYSYISLAQDADLAVAAFTITALRETYISFTKPFMNTGLVMLATKSTPTEGGLWSFLDPFDCWIWICILVSFLVCGACLAVLHRVSPYGRRTVDHPDDLPRDQRLQPSSLEKSYWPVGSSSVSL